MVIERFEVPGLAHYSYMLGSQNQAIVVDPKRDIDTYLDYARSRRWEVTRVLETHIHADYASGARELAEVTGAELLLSGHDQGEDYVYQFPHQPIGDGARFELDGMTIVALHTPGHTPEHLSFLVYESARCSYPVALLSGDFLFVGSLGRPDLLGESSKRRLAELLYESLHEKIRELPDGVEVRPAHGSGSFCGSGMSDRPQSTLGYERASNIFFSDRDLESFVWRILTNVPPFPDYYRRMKQVNSKGPRLLGGLPGGEAIEPKEFREQMERDDVVVIDVRLPEAFGMGHIPGSFNIGLGTLLSTWAAWVVPYDRPILLVTDGSTDPEPARRALVRVGLDEVRGYLDGGIQAWVSRGWNQTQVEQITVEEINERRRRGAEVVDVRGDGEWATGHIEGARHIMGGDLAKKLADLPHNKDILLICATGYRSSVAASVLRRAGFENVVNVSGGMSAWRRLGLPVAICA